jgi:regulation of enolase protein 1 (concanavalin A-like superfamily)
MKSRAVKFIIFVLMGFTACNTSNQLKTEVSSAADSLPVATGLGQPTGEIKLAGIPHALKWENKPAVYVLENERLTIVAGEKTDMFRNPNVTYNTDNAPKLLFAADSNFVFTAAIEHAFESKWDGGALVLKQDSANWIKFCFEKDYTGARRVVSVVTKGVSDDCNSVEINSNKVFFKMAKAGNVITLYYSLTGKQWFLVRHLQFDTSQKLHLGFLAQAPTGKSCTVKFEHITYLQTKITDPYTGE